MQFTRLAGYEAIAPIAKIESKDWQHGSIIKNNSIKYIY